ncbi:acetate--CoA ligase family protein [Microbacterium sp. E-13]|uniref:acetate--CoA ligase family protein n=1 Tax=Microbacterium sp. E-13 TaxID=3404048 RepID=UPI003CF8F67C
MTEQLRAHPISLAAVMKPASVAIIGASSSRSHSTGNQVIRNLRASGYPGRIVVINPAGGSIEGVDAVAAARSAGPVDLAVVAVGPRAVVAAVREAREAGARAALVMSVGMTAGDMLELATFARDSGMPVHGPNCMGLINVAGDVMLWADEGILAGLPAGPVALISQSGSGAIFVARSMTGVGFSHVVSTGSETCTTTADYIDHLVDDEATGVIGLIIESVGAPERFARAVARAREAGKPVVALKVGRSRAGALATVAHTGAMMSEDGVVAAYFDRIGVPLVKDYDALAASLELLAHHRDKSFGSARLAAITISGGQAALTADLADSAGVTLAPLSAETRVRLQEALPGAGVNNPLDAGGSESVEDGWYGRCLDLLAEDPTVDVLLVVTDSQASLNDVEISYEDDIVADARAAALRHAKPFVLASSSSLSIHPSRIVSTDDPFPHIRGIGNALTAIVSAAAALSPAPHEASRPPGLPQGGELEELRALVRASGGRIANDVGEDLLLAYGIETAQSLRTSSIEEAVDWADSVGYPVVLKIDSPDIHHRTDVGGVVVGIASAAALRTEWAEMFERLRKSTPDAALIGAEIQRQLPAGIEAIVGAVRDPGLGATVGVGLGGVLVELLRDAESVFAPASPGAVKEALGRTRLGRLLDGYRGINPIVDDGPLIDTVARVSWLMEDFRGLIAEFEANPVLIDPESGRAFAVDVLVVPTSRA